jgi:hypothetical protein
MSDSISQRFIRALETDRDRLYVEALSVAKSPAEAEGLLQKTLRAGFHTYAEGHMPVDFHAWIHQQLYATAHATPPAAPIEPPAAQAMPADIWARLAAGVQIEAAKSGASKALNPDSVLLSPDPLLAPKKRSPIDDLPDGLNLSPTSRFVLAVAVALVVGISFSLYYCTRTVPSTTTKPAATTGK